MATRTTGRVKVSGRSIIKVGSAADVTGPVISAIVCTPASTSITCTWTTDEAATTVLARGVPLGPPYSTNCANDAGLVTSHSATCSGLASSTLYDLQLTSADAASNTSNSAEQNVTTNAPGGSVTPTCGNTTLTSQVPDNRYQSYVSTISGDGATVTVNTTAAHSLVNGNSVHIQGTVAYNTAKGSPVSITSTGASSFTYVGTATGAETVGFITWMPVTAAGSTYADPILGCTVKRFTQNEATVSRKVPYSTFQVFSPDETKILLLETNLGCFEIYNVSDGSLYKSCSGLGTLSSGSGPRWKDNDTLFFFTGNVLKERVISTGVVSTIHTFTGCTSFGLNNTGDWDTARDRIAGTCYNGSDRYYFSYKRSTDTEGTRYGPTTVNADFTYITEAGDGSFLVFWGSGGTAREKGTELFDGNGVFVRQIVNTSPHGLPGRDASGNDVLLAMDNSFTGSPCVGGVVSVNLANPSTKTCLYAITNLGRDAHLSRTSPIGSRPGWVSMCLRKSGATNTAAVVQSLPSTWATTWVSQIGYNECAIMKMDGTGSWRLTHHGGRDNASVGKAVFGNLSPNGTYLAFNSNKGMCDNVSPVCSPSNAKWVDVWMIQPFA